MANLVLTSDFPSTINESVVARIRESACRRVAWVAAVASSGRVHFPAAQQVFETFGVERLELLALDEDHRQSEDLSRFDAVYLTGGDPITFREKMLRSGFEGRLRPFIAAGHLVIGASGGAMQLSANVSLFRLLAGEVDDVVAVRKDFVGLGAVRFEFLPHLNRHDAAFMNKVIQYSKSLPCDLFALKDGAALYVTPGGMSVSGGGIRVRQGVASSMGEAYSQEQ